MKARYEHDCQQCIYHSTLTLIPESEYAGSIDVYYHRICVDNRIQIVGRYSNEPRDYYSYTMNREEFAKLLASVIQSSTLPSYHFKLMIYMLKVAINILDENACRESMQTTIY